MSKGRVKYECPECGGKVRINRSLGEVELSLSGTQITDAGMAEIKAALPKCRVRN